jgi:hypothetical protein
MKKQETPIEPRTYFAAIRHCGDGYDYVDIQTINGIDEYAGDKAAETDRAIPVWAADNPVVRIGRVEIREINADRQPDAREALIDELSRNLKWAKSYIAEATSTILVHRGIDSALEHARAHQEARRHA